MEAAPAGARAVAWAGAALFATSLAYFLFTYAVTFGETPPVRSTPRAVVVDAVLFGIFAVHHSVFARERVRAWVSRTVGAHLERSLYVWAASLMLIAVCALWQPVPGVAWRAEGALAFVLHGVQLVGAWMTLRSAAAIDIWDLAGVRQAGTPKGRSIPNFQLPTPKSESAASGTGTDPSLTTDWELGVGNWEFKTTGPYGWVRHPIYLGWFLIVFAVPSMTMTRLLFAVISGIYILIAIPLEERSLKRASRGSYDAYTQLVRWKLVPWLY